MPIEDVTVDKDAYVVFTTLVPKDFAWLEPCFAALFQISTYENGIIYPFSGAVTIHVAVEVGDWVRSAGSDVAKGQRLLSAGELLGSAELGMLAAVGAVRPRVRRQPGQTHV